MEVTGSCQEIVPAHNHPIKTTRLGYTSLFVHGLNKRHTKCPTIQFHRKQKQKRCYWLHYGKFSIFGACSKLGTKTHDVSASAASILTLKKKHTFLI